MSTVLVIPSLAIHCLKQNLREILVKVQVLPSVAVEVYVLAVSSADSL